MNSETVIRELGIKLLKAEIARRTKQVDETLDAVSSRIRIDSWGGTYVVDANGQRDDSATLGSVLDEAKVNRPDLFEDRPAPGGRKDNPFDKASAHFSVTRQMALIRENPEEAERLADAAGVPAVWRR